MNHCARLRFWQFSGISGFLKFMFFRKMFRSFKSLLSLFVPLLKRSVLLVSYSLSSKATSVVVGSLTRIHVISRMPVQLLLVKYFIYIHSLHAYLHVGPSHVSLCRTLYLACTCRRSKLKVESEAKRGKALRGKYFLEEGTRKLWANLVQKSPENPPTQFSLLRSGTFSKLTLDT